VLGSIINIYLLSRSCSLSYSVLCTAGIEMELLTETEYMTYLEVLGTHLSQATQAPLLR
jgi:hypothetical protein